MFIFGSLLFVAVASALLGLIVLVRNLNSSTNRAFAFFALSIAAWSLGLAFFVNATTEVAALNWAKFYYVSALFIPLTLDVFVNNYLKANRLSLFSLAIYSSIIFYTAAIILPGVLTLGAVIDSNNSINLNHVAYTSYALLFLVSFIKPLWRLFSSYKVSSRSQRNQLRYLLIGIIAAGFLGAIFNLFLPWVGNYNLVWLGPQFLLLFIALISYAIVKHRLFDIRFIVARSIAYILLLITLASIYGLIVFGLTNIFISEQSGMVSRELQSLYIIGAIFLAFTFQPLKKFFDHLTNNIFYRDGYNTQEQLKLLGDILAEEIDIRRLTKRVVNLLADTLKPQYAKLIVLEDDAVFHLSTNSVDRKHPTVKNLSGLDGNIMLYDQLEENKEDFREHNVDLVARIETQGTLVGFIILGPKSSGSIYNNQDVEFLTIASKELGVALENSKNFAEIQKFNETLKKKVKNATTNLRQKNAKLRELDQAKDDFISMASHQLRTPLTTVKGYLSMLSDGDFGELNKKQQEVSGLAYASAERMVYLIADLLNVSRIDTGKFAIEPTQVDLVEMVNEEVKQLQRGAKAKGLKLSFSAPKKFPKVMLDDTKTRQVIMNFIDNAIYYTQKGEVNVELKKTKDSIEFIVVDTGIGVPEKAKEDLFTKFFRAENARKARPDGTGLGLFMAKKVITGQGGSVIFRSKENEGSTFGFRFSLAAVRAKK